MPSQKYIFLDRDGVINHDSSEYIKTPDEWNPIERSLEAIKKLTDNDFQIIIITNQSGINRDIITPDNFLKINLKMLNAIEKSGGSILSILYCPSLPSDDCQFRKPGSGMFIEISKRLNFNLSDCFSIGDSPRDIDASVAAKCIALGVRTGNGKTIEKDNIYQIPMFDDLYDAVESIVLK